METELGSDLRGKSLSQVMTLTFLKKLLLAIHS
jgi:hypothetical protein